jgi:starvation-inducible DNA-binding protein
MAMRTTKNDLGQAVRSKLVELLNARLADATDLHTQCKQAHWNVRGPSFFSLHELFDKVAEAAQEYADDLAERAVQLGGYARGTARDAAQHSTLAEYPHDASSGRDHVQAVSAVLATFARSVRAAIDTSAREGEADTSDLFTEISRGTDKWLWMVEAHLEENR